MLSVIASSWVHAHSALLAEILINILLGYSLQVVLRAGVFSVAGVGFFTIGAYATGIFAVHHYAAGVAMVLSLIGCGLVAYLLSIPLLRLSGHYLAIATIAFDLVVTVVAANGGNLTGGTIGLVGIPVSVSLSELLGVVAFVSLLCIALERGRIGRSIVVLADDNEVAATIGIGARSVRRGVFVFSGLLGAAAGGCYALMFSAVTPDQAGFSLVALILSLAVIGGISTWFGCVIGSILITSAPFWLSGMGKWSQVAYGGLLLIVILWAPTGLMGLVRSAWRRIRSQDSDPLGPVAARPSMPANRSSSQQSVLVDQRDFG